jgi:hypothetical protein
MMQRLLTWFFPTWLGSPRCISLGVAVLAFLSVFATIDPTGDMPWLWGGPGLSSDEPFNAMLGIDFADKTLRGSVRELKRAVTRFPDHPPLGRFWIGLCHELTFPMFTPLNPYAGTSGVDRHYSMACARLGSATAFAFTVFLVGTYTGRRHGRLAGLFASLAMWLCPRAFGHAHIAALESCINATFAACVLVTAETWFNRNTRLRGAMVVTGLLLGLAMLTKIQAIFLPLPLIVFALIRHRHRAILPLGVVAVIALGLFVIGFPYLWDDPIQGMSKYFSRASERSTTLVWYLNQKWADKDVPWHYPWVIFAVTTPVGLQALAWIGALMRRRPVAESTSPEVTAFVESPTRLEHLYLIANILFPLFVFSLPGVALYDGERLFSVVFPLWAVLVGRGVVALGERIAELDWPRRSRAVVAVLFLVGVFSSYALPAWDIFRAPNVALCYYNRAIGGLPGAARCGFQIVYWATPWGRDELEQAVPHVRKGALLNIVPVPDSLYIHHFWSQSYAVQRQQLWPRHYDSRSGPEFLLVTLRKEYLAEEEVRDWTAAPALFEVNHDGVRLGALLSLPIPKAQGETKEPPNNP